MILSRLLLLGAGGHGKVVAEAAIASGRWNDIAFLDGGYPKLSKVLNWPVLGPETDALKYLQAYPEIFVSVGDNRRRLELIVWCLESGFRVPIVVHPRAWVSPTATLQEGTVVIGNAVINACASLGRGCIVNTGATVDHDCRLDDAVHVSPGAHIGGGTFIGERSWIGIGAAIRQGIKVGSDVMVGAGAAVVGDLPSGVEALGVPAKVRSC